MTLHLVYYSSSVVICVGDRLLTTGPLGKPRKSYDVYANKSIFVDSSSAQFVISYAGSAYIDKKPTDVWLAEKIMDSKWNTEAPMNFGGDYHLNLGQTLVRIRDALRYDFGKQSRDSGIEVLVAGWRWKAKSVREGKNPVPFTVQIGHAGTKDADVAEHFRLDLKWGRVTSDVVSVGAQLEPEQLTAIELLRTGMGVRDPYVIEQQLADVVRATAADNTKGVGTELMSFILNANGLANEIRFLRDVGRQGLSAYTPFIIRMDTFDRPLEYTQMRPTYPQLTIKTVPALVPTGNIMSMRGQSRHPRSKY